jgi:uncharacterized protein (TIGR02594 family)
MTLANAFEIAGRNLGMNEREQNAALQDFMRTGGQNLDPAVTAWCAAYVNASLSQAGMQGTGRLNARSFMDWGQATDTPNRGDIAVFSRGDPNGWQGHVGFFDGYGDDGRIRVLGGNQGDAVSLSYYDPARLLGFRTAGENTGASPLQNTMTAGGPQNRPAARPPGLGQPAGPGAMPGAEGQPPDLAGLFEGASVPGLADMLPGARGAMQAQDSESERARRRRRELLLGGAESRPQRGGLPSLFG